MKTHIVDSSDDDDDDDLGDGGVDDDYCYCKSYYRITVVIGFNQL